MKKKLIFSGMVLLALVLTTGTFAYTYPGAAAATLNGTISDEQFAIYQASANQPDWESILPNGEYASEILLPNAAGDETGISSQFPDSGEHWDKVDDRPADDGATYVATGSPHYERDLYNLTNHTEEKGLETDIKSISVYFRFADDSSSTVKAKAAIKTHGSIFEGSEESQTGADYVTKSYEWKINPYTLKAWTWEEIEALQAGVSLQGKNKNQPAYCTQVYVAVNYKFTITEGELPEGDLFDITPHPDYTGDLQVRIYLTNTSALLKAYRYLNMELYVRYSLEAGKTPNYQILSMENGVATFNINGRSADSYTVKLWGGSYRLTSSKTEEWGVGWSIAPEFYCEVTQR